MVDFERADWSDRSEILSSIITGEIVGIVYENVLSEEMTDIFIKGLSTLRASFFTDLNEGNGYSLPGMFGQLHKTQPLEIVNSYFRNIDKFCEDSAKVFEFNVGEWINQTLSLAFSPFQTNILPGFLPYSFRVVYPGRGGLFLHKDGDLLPYIHDDVSKRISERIRPESMMSWYFTLRSPLEGGELWVADSVDSDLQKAGQEYIQKADGHLIHPDQIDHTTVRTPKGSLLLFKGGSHWHKVIPPAIGSEERVTLGGFMALSNNGDEIFYWS